MAIQFENQVVAGVVLIRDAIQSQNFQVDSQGTVIGWQIRSDGGSTFTSVTVSGNNWGIDDQGVGSFSSVNVDDDVVLDGTSLVESLDLLPDGIVAYGDSSIYNNVHAQWTVDTATSGSASVAGAGASILAAEFDMADWRADRYYLIVLSYTVNSTTADLTGRFRIVYTLDGTAPTTSTGILDGSEIYASTGGLANFQARITHTVVYSPGSNYDLVRMALLFNKASSPVGLLSIEMVDPNSKLQWSIIDIGPQAIAIAGGSLSQKSKSSGTPDPDPPSTYVKTYSATWSRGWNNGGSGSIYSTNGELVQGASPATTSSGNRISWVGFDFSTIQSNLSGATVKKVEVFLYFTHWYNNSGGTAIIGTHKSTATSAPSYNGTLDNQNRKSVGSWAANSGKWVDITSAVGSDFKTGNATGIVLGQGPSSSQVYYGKGQGNTQSNEPKLRITYTK